MTEDAPKKRKTHTSSEVKRRWNKKNYDAIHLTVPKGQKEVMKAHAEIYDGGSVNGFIKRAIDEQMKRDLETSEN